MELKPGKMTALVGPSGGGKTSCVSLLKRLYEPEEGQILLDGQPLHHYNHKYFHQKVLLSHWKEARSLQKINNGGMLTFSTCCLFCVDCRVCSVSKCLNWFKVKRWTGIANVTTRCQTWLNSCTTKCRVKCSGVACYLKVTDYAKCTFWCVLYINMCPRCVRRIRKYNPLSFPPYISKNGGTTELIQICCGHDDITQMWAGFTLNSWQRSTHDQTYCPLSET